MLEVTNDEANDRADEILGREEFITASEPGFFERGANRVLEFIGDILGRVFETIFGGTGGAAGQGFAIVLLVLAVAILGFAIYRAITSRPPKEDEATDGTRVVFDEVVEPEALQADMERFIASGDWRAAVIAGFRLAIVGLIDVNIAREVSGATTGDFASAVERRRPELLPAYIPAARAFERAFYSDIDIEQPDMEQVTTLLDRLRAGVGGVAS